MDKINPRRIKLVIAFSFLLLINLFYTNCSKGFMGQDFVDLSSVDGSSPKSTISHESFIPESLSEPPRSPLPKFLKKTYTTDSTNTNFAIVYIRIPRVKETMNYVNYLGVLKPNTKNWDLLQTLPETSFRTTGMSGPGQLIYRDRSGNEKVLFDCMASANCLPMDPTVSFDGSKVIFSILRGKFSKVEKFGQTFPYNVITSTEAQLAEVNIATGAIKYLTHIPGTYDTGPVYLPDGKIMFTSTRSNEFGSSHLFYTPIQQYVLQLWKSDVDGNNAERVGPHDLNDTLHPYVMTDGRVLFSTWQTRHLQAFGQNNGTLGNPGTQDNKFWLASVDHTGGRWMSVLGAHGHQYTVNGNLYDFRALHFVAETTNNWLCSTDYYRENNFGSGQILCWQKEDLEIEGRGPEETTQLSFIFMPRNLMPIASWATSEDRFSDQVNGVYVGKLRDPVALPGNQLLLTHMKGVCSRIQAEYSVESIQTEPYGCDGGIYKTSIIPSNSPADLIKIVDDPDWHEFMPRVAESYSFVYGKEKPDLPNLQRDKNNRCILTSSSMETETENIAPYTFFNTKDCAMQGCKARAIPMSKVKAIRFWKVLPNKDKTTYVSKLRTVSGNEQILLGDVPLNKDGSFAAELPCDTPYIMAGVDEDGNTILRDQVVQSLRAGEVRTCKGCHLHSKPGRPIEDSIAYSQFSSPFQLTLGKVPTMQKGWWIAQSQALTEPEYTKDILPILNRRCVSCHSGPSAPNGLRLDISGTSLFNYTTPAMTSSWFRIVADSNQYFVANKRSYFSLDPNNYSLEKPHSSVYVNSAFAIESLFLWKAANKRLDGRSDSSYTNDVDFGADHPTEITESELKILRDWLDSGAYAKYIN